MMMAVPMEPVLLPVGGPIGVIGVLRLAGVVVVDISTPWQIDF